MDWQIAILILGIITSFVGIAAGAVQVIDYMQKRREAKQTKPTVDLAAAAPTAAPPPHPTSKAPTNNLPAQTTPLIGRKKEVAAAVELLRHAEVRLVTLTGLGGVGKTRIGLQAASELLDDFRDGVFFVDLEPINDVSLVAYTIAQALGVKETAGWSILDSLKGYLRERQMLLMLDNFEQVAGATPIIVSLLAAAPEVKALITSRTALGIPGEHDFSVPPMELPDLRALPSTEELSHNEAVALFVQRARAVKPDFALSEDNAPTVAEICSRLDGLPLAIELAAARIKLLSPQAMLERLSNRLKLLTGGARTATGRQETLRDTIDWSYDLLDAGAKTLFRRISVFVGGCTLEATEAVCNADNALDVDVLDEMESLVDKSLLHRIRREQAGDEPRFGMLETIREYAGERLVDSKEMEDLRKQHAEYYLSLAEKAEPELLGPQQVEWMDRLEIEHDNLRAALGWSKSSKETGELGLRMAGALLWFWQTRGYITEGRERLAGLLMITMGMRNAARSHALIVAGRLAFLQGDYQSARSQFNESLEISREIEDRLGTAHALAGLGSVALGQGDYPSARALFEECLATYRESGDKWSVAMALSGLGDAELRLGYYDKATAVLEESLSLFQEVGNRQGAAFMMAGLGDAALVRGDLARAAELFEKSLTLRRELGHKLGMATSMLGLAEVACAQGQPERAARLLGSAQTLFDAVGYRMERAVGDRYERTLASTNEQLGEDAFNRAFEEGRNAPDGA